MWPKFPDTLITVEKKTSDTTSTRLGIESGLLGWNIGYAMAAVKRQNYATIKRVYVVMNLRYVCK